MTNSFKKAIPPADLLRQWGLEDAVFNADEARKEQRLDQVMEYPDWFFEVLGDVKNLDYVIITGPRGSGKSSIRRSIVEHCSTELGNEILGGKALCISIDHDSPNWVRNFIVNNIKPSVDYFCEELADQLIVAILTYSQPDELKQNLDKKEGFLLERYIYKLRATRPDDISNIADKLLSTYTKIRRSDAVNDWLTVITSFFGNAVSLENRAIKTDAINDIPVLIGIIKKCGFDAVYVLVDELDEYDGTTGKPDFAAEIIVPILSSMNLLEKGSIGLKFFLSAPVYRRLNRISKEMKLEIRYDRTLQPEPYELAWSDEHISTMLKKRLMTYSSGNVNSLVNFCEENFTDIDDKIVSFSFKNPRHMIQFCNRIVRLTARTADSTNYKITHPTFEKALVEFCKYICTNVYPSNFIDALVEMGISKEIHEKLFAEKHNLSTDKSHEVLTELTELGAMKVKKNIDGSYLYSVIDPRVQFLIDNKILTQQ